MRALAELKAGTLPTTVANRLRVATGRRRVVRHRPLLANAGVTARRVNDLLAVLGVPGRYLEIGVHRGLTLETVTAERRVAVDPAPLCRVNRRGERAGLALHTVESDEFFRTCAEQFDIVLVDGLHLAEQAYRDLINALRCCETGVVLLDDTVPSSAEAASRDRDASQREASVWQGDVYRVVMLLDRHHRDQLGWATVTDGGKPQTVVWRCAPGVVRAVDDHLVEATAAATYTDVFGHGVPEFFHPMNWSAILPRLERGLRHG